MRQCAVAIAVYEIQCVRKRDGTIPTALGNYLHEDAKSEVELSAKRLAALDPTEWEL